MANDYGVTTGHSPFSRHRFRDDVTHVIIFDDLLENGHVRVRLYLNEDAYQLAQKAAAKKLIRIIYDAEVSEGCIITKSKPKTRQRIKKKKEERYYD